MGVVIGGGSATRLISNSYCSIDDMLELVEREIDNIRTPCNVTAWMDLIRTTRQPQILWEIDYITPRKTLLKINDLIRESEIILYGSKNGLQLNDGYTADIYQEIAFHTIRTHLRSEENDFDTAIQMMQQLYDEWYDRISDIRKSNLLVHACLIFLCNKMFDESLRGFNQHWALLKYMNAPERIKIGIWDNHIILQLAYWYFVKHVEDFRDFYSIFSDTPSDTLWNHKKIALMNFMEHDNSWIVSFCGLPFYNHARTLMRELPEWNKKRSTPTNFFRIFEEDNLSRYSTSGANTEEEMYKERYNEQFRYHVVPDPDAIDNALYSYYFFQVDYAKQDELKDRLLLFINKHISDYRSILDLGCGTAFIPDHKNLVNTRIDISDKVCYHLKNTKSVDVIQKCMSRFVKETKHTFDLCIACDSLPHLSRVRLNVLMQNLPSKHFGALIDTRDNWKDDILEKTSLSHNVNLHKTVMTHEDWIAYLSKHYVINHMIEGPWLYVFGKQS